MASSKPKSRLLRLNNSRRTAPAHSYEPVVGHRFDETTGQIYTETTVSIQNGDDADWDRLLWINEGQSVLKPQERIGKLGKRGTRSLQDVAIDVAVQNLSDSSPDILDCLPVPVVQRIWDERRSDSFHNWKMFSKYLSGTQRWNTKRFRHTEVIQYPRSPLETYLKPLTSPSFDFITSISITTPFSLADLAKISRCTNIGTLEVINRQGRQVVPSVTDMLVRSWSIAARDEGSFKVLRVLKLLSHEEITGRSLLYLNTFPALAVFEVGGCSFDRAALKEAKVQGWLPTAKQVLPQLENACTQRIESLKVLLGFQEPICTGSQSQDFSWDEALTASFERVGDLRDNIDLGRAGIVVNSDSACVGHNGLKWPIPIASLSLGYGGYVDRSFLAFLRIKLPAQGRLRETPAESLKLDTEHAKSKPAANAARSQPKLNRNKKRTLDDLLSTFT